MSAQCRAVLIASSDPPGEVPRLHLDDPAVWGVASGEPEQQQPVGPGRGKLKQGSRVAVIGGGPAGSLFSYFLLKTLELVGVRVDVDIYEPRDFSRGGPSGCNHCGGVVSESLVQILGAEGIMLPADVIQRGIDSYMMHMDIGDARIVTQLQEKRIAAVYRGNGPRDAPPAMTTGFDRYLLEMAVARGAVWRRKLVTGVGACASGWRVETADRQSREYDLLVVASGINSALLPVVEQYAQGFRRPQALKTFIAEFRLGRALIEASLGTSMHVFLLDLPRLEFAALIPKGDYVTLCMLGQDVDEDLVNKFLNAPEVRACFPASQVPANVCQCFPRINVGAARMPYADGLVFIGDCGVARLYKDGIGSAYRTAKAAAMTCALHGTSTRDFERHYLPACRLLTRDNAIGRLVFAACHLVQRLRFARRGVLRMVLMEQANPAIQARMSGVLWDVFSGSAPYTDVLLRTVRPVFIARLLWNLVAANVHFAPRSAAKESAA